PLTHRMKAHPVRRPASRASVIDGRPDIQPKETERMSEPFIGQIALFPYNFAPRNWAFCQGQILPISQNTALFSLLGTTFGGNGQTTFALPDLRGRVPNSSGQGPGLSSYDL